MRADYIAGLVREARAHANISQLGAGARSLILEMADALERHERDGGR
jgi:hypothetical protein